jgi:Pyruvate/2-oxoacid:ferredoxin oxidoreductase delta subunit
MNENDNMFRLLQRHLDKQAVGFPAVRSGADIRLLKRLFSPEEARLALRLSYKPIPLAKIIENAGRDFSTERIERLLDEMSMKGVIASKKKNGTACWHLIPLIVGMYESQAGNLTPEFMADAGSYMKTFAFGKSFLAVKPSQMRTIPINKSIPVEHNIATYDQIRAIVQNSRGPFAAFKCICREGMAIRQKPCKKTTRLETCLAFGDMAGSILRMKHGHELTRDETLALLQQNEDEGLVLQPANAKQPEFVCSCCGCCCGMLSFQKRLPRPIDFWTSNFYAEVDSKTCIGCGRCVARCQVNAVTPGGAAKKAKINLSRCIGCGLCVPTCPSKSVRLKKRAQEMTIPKDADELYDRIMANKKGAAGQWLTFLKMALKIKP